MKRCLVKRLPRRSDGPDGGADLRKVAALAQIQAAPPRQALELPRLAGPGARFKRSPAQSKTNRREERGGACLSAGAAGVGSSGRRGLSHEALQP